MTVIQELEEQVDALLKRAQTAEGFIGAMGQESELKDATIQRLERQIAVLQAELDQVTTALKLATKTAKSGEYFLASMEAELASWRRWEDDAPDDLTPLIEAVMRKPDNDLYGQAMNWVGNRRSKAALVRMTYWLAYERKQAHEALEAVLQSDMAMREEDEGHTSKTLNQVRVALGKATVS